MRQMIGLLVIGCGGRDPDPPTRETCLAVQTEAACAATDGCMPETGVGVGGEPVYAGCIVEGAACDDAEIVCAPDDDPSACVFFNSRCFLGSGCAPGWSECAT